MFNKHSGEMVGFVDLGSINNHLLDYEDSFQSDDTSPKCYDVFYDKRHIF